MVTENPTFSPPVKGRGTDERVAVWRECQSFDPTGQHLGGFKELISHVLPQGLDFLPAQLQPQRLLKIQRSEVDPIAALLDALRRKRRAGM